MAQAYYNFEAKIIQRSKGQSSVAAAAYNAGEKIKDERTGILHDYTRKHDVHHTAILTPENAPAWASDRQELWNRAEREEKRKDSQVGRQFIMCFPTCLTHEEKIVLSKQFLQEEFVNKGYAVDVAYHDFKGKNAHNPHAHVLVSSRAMSESGFCSFKDRSWNGKERLFELREKWAAIQNRHFEQTGREERVDHRSYQERGIDRTPQVHEGKAVSAIRQKIARGERQDTTSLIDLNNEIRQLNAQLEFEKTTLAELKAKAAREQDNNKQNDKQIVATTKEVLKIAQPSVRELKAEAEDLHQQQRAQFTLDIAEIVKASKPQPAPKVQEPAPSERTPEKRGTMPPPPHEPNDRTYRAVWRQLQAFEGDGMFEVGILNPETGKMRNLTYHRDSLLKIDPETKKASTLSYLKAENAKGKHLYVRPAPHPNGDTQGYVLVDDIDQVTAEELREKGLAPSVLVETSWKNCQAWIKVDERLTRNEASKVARLIAREAGGDPGSAGYQHYGRLAGFTNRKEEHLDLYTGQYPWVLVHHAERTQASAGAAWVARARAELEEEQKQKEATKACQTELASEKASEAELEKAVRAFAKYSAKTTTQDPSTRDWIALKSMAKRGYSLEALEHALWHSEGLEERKKGHTADYVQRTLAKLQEDRDVLEALHRRQENKARRAERKDARARERDERTTIEQWQQYKERERDNPASSASTRQERRKQPGEERKAQSSPGKGKTNSTMTINPNDVTVTTLGALNEEQVRWIVTKTLESKESQKQLEKAAWALTQDTSKWGKLKAEYLKELARTVNIKGAQAYHPYTDAEIGIKLRMAGFGKQRIYDCLKENSPFAAYLDEEAKTRYLYKGIAPLMDNPKVNQKIAQWNQFRTREAIALPEERREAYIKEHRLEELKLSITKERWDEQRMQHSSDRGMERER
jgi:hypothetical protein